MFNRKQEQRKDTSGWRRALHVAVFLAALLMLSGAVTTVQAQKMPGAFYSGAWFGSINPHYHTPYYLPSYDGDRYWDWGLYPYFLTNYYRRGHSGRYDQWYWYPWSFRWGRYDVPNYSWWSFGEGYFDEYGTGSMWMSGDPRSRGELKAIQTVERERMATRVTRLTFRERMRNTGVSRGRGSSIGSSGGGSSGGSSGGGSSIGSSGGGSSGGGSKGGKK